MATVVSPQVPVWRMASLQSARVLAWGLVRCGRLVRMER